MPLDIKGVYGNQIHLIVRGRLKADEFRAAQENADPIISGLGRVKLLCILDGFEGWEGSNEWSVPLSEDPAFERIAIVGDRRWEEDALAFTAAGARPTEIRFFDEDQMDEAVRWLG